MQANHNDSLLEIRDLTVDYCVPGRIRALDGISLEVRAGESVALLGESGSGKSTLAMAIMRILPPNAHISRGAIRFWGEDLLSAKEKRLQQLRGARISMIFQQPGMALNPLMRVGRQVAEVVRAHSDRKWSECRREATRALEQVFENGLNRIADSFPHELSGGERQRISIAQALVRKPELLLADEPTAALDSVTQAEVLKVLRRLKGLCTTIFITHNPAVLPGLVDRVVVIRTGHIVEAGNLWDVYRKPSQQYTAALLSCAQTVVA